VTPANTLHTSQRELFKATREIEISKQQRQRLNDLAQSGALPGVRIVEIDNQIQRLDVNVQAYRQDLLARGLSQDQIEAASKGEFVTEITVRAPNKQSLQHAETFEHNDVEFSFEMQELKVELGQQVEAGRLLCSLSDHRLLLIEGRGFKDDMPLVQQAAKNNLPVEVQFDFRDTQTWPPVPDRLGIHHVANSIDLLHKRRRGAADLTDTRSA